MLPLVTCSPNLNVLNDGVTHKIFILRVTVALMLSDCPFCGGSGLMVTLLILAGSLELAIHYTKN